MKLLFSFCFCAFALTISAAGQTHRVLLNLTYGSNVSPELKGVHGPQVSYAWRNRFLNWHEVELGNISLNRKLNNTPTSVISATDRESFMLRYQYTIPLFAQKLRGPIQLNAGMGVYTYNRFIQTIPFISTLFPSRSYLLRYDAYIAPGLTYAMHEHWSISISIPVNFETVEFSGNRVMNPAWSIAEQRFSQTKFYTFHNPGIAIRAGIGATF